MIYKQHRIRVLGESIDSYELMESFIKITLSKWLNFNDRTITIAYDNIDSVTYKRGFWGWLLGYATVIIDVGNDRFVLPHVHKGTNLVEDLEIKINEFYGKY